MAIIVKAYLTMRQVVGNRASFEADFNEISIRELLFILALRFGPRFESMVFEKNTHSVGPDIRILVNGKHYGTLPKKLSTILKDGDEIGLFPPIAGG
ncbi:MAG: MoaD family protein [Desulfobacterales bacterium]|nr:MoaD family protein [Desulfobacterales bacterium]